ncbi:MAG: outer membrane protein assembly factor BamD [Desulfovibrionaceae bacterium]
MNNRLALLARCVSMVVLLFATGCGIIDYFLLPPPDDTAQELFELGKEAMQEKNYSKAAEQFTQLKDRYPFSPYTPQAELALGDAFFLDEKFHEAADAYSEFESLHPSNKEIPYVLYQIGLSNLKTFTSIDKPNYPVTEALQYFYRLRESFPDSEYAAKAVAHIDSCRRIVADHEIFVADFYWRTEKYQAAWERYRFVLANFADLPGVSDYVTKRSELAYLKFQEKQSQQTLDRMEGSWRDYFDWL